MGQLARDSGLLRIDRDGYRRLLLPLHLVHLDLVVARHGVLLVACVALGGHRNNSTVGRAERLQRSKAVALEQTQLLLLRRLLRNDFHHHNDGGLADVHVGPLSGDWVRMSAVVRDADDARQFPHAEFVHCHSVG